MSGEEYRLNEQIKWVSLAITHVEYPQGDWLGKCLAIVSLVPLMIIVGFITLVIFRRDLHTISFFCGILLNEVINWLLKHSIRELRPCQDREVLYTEYGMPSSHSQLMWFFATYAAFFLLIRIHHVSNSSVLDNGWKYLVTLGVFWTTLAVSYSRVYLQYHTLMQVVCGAVLGVILASAWFAVTQFVFTPLFPSIASWPICEYFMIRDSTLIPNVLWFEYTCHRTEMRSRHRKLVSRRSQSSHPNGAIWHNGEMTTSEQDDSPERPRRWRIRGGVDDRGRNKTEKFFGLSREDRPTRDPLLLWGSPRHPNINSTYS